MTKLTRAWFALLSDPPNRTALWRGALIALLMSAHAAPAEEMPAWGDMADTVFQPVSEPSGAPAMLLPAAMAEDSDGFLWVGGEAGLVRWDAYRFRHYAADTQRPDGLPDHNILALHTDTGGQMWVGTVNGGLARYVHDTDRFQTVPLNDGHGPASCVWGMDDDGTGGLWVGTSTGLFHLDRAGHVVARLRHDPARMDSLPADKVQSVLRDRHGDVWIGGRAGLARDIGGHGHFAVFPLPAADGATPEVSHLLQDDGGRIWIGSRNQGAFVLDPATGSVQRLAATAPAATGADATEIMAMASLGRSRVWLATFGQGIVEVDGARLTSRRILHNPFVNGTLRENTVSALYRDRSGLLWVGTSVGLSRHNPTNAAILTLLGSTDRKDGLRVNDAPSVLARQDGSLWVGSQSNGLQILYPSGARGAILPVQRVFSLAAAATGPVYVGTRNGLYMADASGHTLTKLIVPGRAPTAAVNALLMLDNVLWLGGGEDGVWELHVAGDGVFSVARHAAPPALTNATIRTIALAPDGRLAVGTDHGFNLLDRATGGIEAFLPGTAGFASADHGLSPGAAMSFAVDRQRRLWVGTDGAGIDVLTGHDAAHRPLFHHIGRAEGLPDADIGKLLVDGRGHIWASTDNGLAMIDPDSFEVRGLRAPDGVMIDSYWSNSGDVTPQGDLVFGGLGGVTIVRPAQLAPWTYPAPIVITETKIGGIVAEPAGGDADLLSIPPTVNSLAVEFAALDFSAPELNQYSYRLEGFDTGWVNTDSSDRIAAYTNLSPGDYTLRLRASNRAGIWTERAGALRIRVLPAWYQTIWFHAVVLAAALSIIAALVQGRTVLLRQRQRELERQVDQRTRELSASQAKLQHFAYFDSLTALPNRRAFNEQFQSLIQYEPLVSFALVLIDLDGFKHVNDSLGHQAGDQLLVIAAGRMRNLVRESDFIARLGGDEFAILVKHVTDQDMVTALCKRITAEMAMPFAIKDTRVTIGASSGAALFPQHGQSQDDLYRHVDLALYEAKRIGRGAWCWYNETLLPSHAP